MDVTQAALGITLTVFGQKWGFTVQTNKLNQGLDSQALRCIEIHYQF